MAVVRWEFTFSNPNWVFLHYSILNYPTHPVGLYVARLGYKCTYMFLFVFCFMVWLGGFTISGRNILKIHRFQLFLTLFYPPPSMPFHSYSKPGSLSVKKITIKSLSVLDLPHSTILTKIF